jgi:hypothetical protein
MSYVQHVIIEQINAVNKKKGSYKFLAFSRPFARRKQHAHAIFHAWLRKNPPRLEPVIQTEVNTKRQRAKGTVY